jgi:hypothetical protein
VDSLRKPPQTSVVDFAGRRVSIGSRVRFRGFSALRSLSRLERRGAQSMIGETSAVEEIDAAGQAWGTKWRESWRALRRRRLPFLLNS